MLRLSAEKFDTASFAISTEAQAVKIAHLGICKIGHYAVIRTLEGYRSAGLSSHLGNLVPYIKSGSPFGGVLMLVMSRIDVHRLPHSRIGFLCEDLRCCRLQGCDCD